MGKYLIRVEGRLSDELVATFPTLNSSQCPQTVLHGAVNDQATLSEILDHLRGLGVHVIGVHHVAAVAPTPAPAQAPRRDTSSGHPAPASSASLPPI